MNIKQHIILNKYHKYEKIYDYIFKKDNKYYTTLFILLDKYEILEDNVLKIFSLYNLQITDFIIEKEQCVICEIESDDIDDILAIVTLIGKDIKIINKNLQIP